MAAKSKRRLTRFEQVGIAAVIIIAGMYLYVNRMYKPLQRDSEKARKEVGSLQKRVDTLKNEPPNSAVFKSLQKAQAEWQQAKSRLDHACKCLASSDDVPLVLASVMENAARSNLKIRALDTAEAPRPAASDQQRSRSAATAVVAPDRSYHRLVLVGGYKNVRDFLDSLGKLPKKVWTENIVISLRNENELLVSLLLRI